MVNEDDDSTIRNLKLVPLPPLGDKDAMNEHLDDALSRAVRVGKIPASLWQDVSGLVSVCLANGLWIRRLRFGKASTAEVKRQARRLGAQKVVIPLLSLTFQSVAGHEYNVSYGPILPKTTDRFILQEYTGILYETDDLISYSHPTRILYDGTSRQRVKAAIRKLGKPGMRAVLME